MVALLKTVDMALGLYWWVIIASAVFSWLYAFKVVNPNSQAIATIGRALYQMTEPALRPIRRIVPMFGGLDVTPILLLLVIYFLRNFIWSSLIPMFQ